MPHRLNTNKQFMIGNGILAFAVIIVVVIFVYMSLRAQQQKKDDRHFLEHYTICLDTTFLGHPTSVYLNDSLLCSQPMTEAPLTLSVDRLAELSALLIVDETTDGISFFQLDPEGGNYTFSRNDDGKAKQWTNGR